VTAIDHRGQLTRSPYGPHLFTDNITLGGFYNNFFHLISSSASHPSTLFRVTFAL
jgi:hypothetical protein